MNKTSTADPSASQSFSRVVKLCLPMTLAMLVNSSYTLVDAYFVAQFAGENAFSAISTIFPIHMLLIALAFMLANGCSVLVSQALGKKDKRALKITVNSAVTVALLCAFSIALTVILQHHQILTLFQVPENLLDDAQSYLLITSFGAVTLFLLSIFSELLRSFRMMSGLLLVIFLGAIANGLLNYVLIGLFSLGVEGAAFSTVITQLVGIGLAFTLLRRNPMMGKIRIGLPVHGLNIIRTGAPVFFNYLGIGIVILICNFSIVNYVIDAEATLAAYGVVVRLNTFVVLPIMAISLSCQTLIAHDFGAKQKHQVSSVFYSGLLLAAIYLSLIWFVVQFKPEWILAQFFDNPGTLSESIAILQKTMLLIPIAGLTVLVVATLQAINAPGTALLITTSKIYLVLIPLLLIVPVLGQFESLWYSFPIAELVMVMGIICTACMLKLTGRTLLSTEV